MLIFEQMQRVQLKRFLIHILSLQLLFIGHLHAQQSPKCGFDKTIQEILNSNAAFVKTIDAVRSEGMFAHHKTTADVIQATIPVVFHVVLNTAQLAAIGGEQGVLRRIDSQMLVLNRDYNAKNSDSVAIPSGFRALFANTGIRFGLAHTTPVGLPTPGYEIIITTQNGFNLDGGNGSGFGFSSSKYTASGGADAWDPESYLNIWIINPLEDGGTTNILGLAVPVYLATEGNDISILETGITLHYGAFGKRSGQFDLFVPGSDLGRTLTHEVGHYFELLHIWGDDDGKCPFNGGEDDGIEDTPPQAHPSSGCSNYPKYDACTKSNDIGIMYMNYMDYSQDRCLLLFTHGQAQKMQNTLRPGGRTYGLTQQPWLLDYPDTVNTPDLNDFTAYPNPADEVLNVVFRKQPSGLNAIMLVDMTGRVINTREYDRQASFYTFDVAGLYTGIYFLVIDFDTGKEVRKVWIR